MTTPDFLSHLPTAAQAQRLHATARARLEDAVRRTAAERDAARDMLMDVNNQLDAARTALSKLNRDAELYPHSEERDTERAEIAARIDRLTECKPSFTALHGAATLAHQSATLELAWLDRPDPRSSLPTDTAATLLWHRSEIAAVTAPASGYTVDTYSLPQPGQPWRKNELGTVRRSRARSVVQNWMGEQGAYVLADRYGRLYVARAAWRLEMTPTDLAPPPTEGDVLRTALSVYGFPAYEDGEGGFTWLSVPLDPDATEKETYAGLHFRIASGEVCDRPASAHDEPWGLSVYDADGDYVTTLDPAPGDATLAQDCAHAARAVAQYARTQR
ncbi:hypothetical protein HFP70_35540 [Streptomyces sp. ARC14]|uniref:hypothetical protein n=1 Tax=Streptomyces sp. ARC14 TaxID=2724152 RepID=UPI0038571BA3